LFIFVSSLQKKTEKQSESQSASGLFFIFYKKQLAFQISVKFALENLKSSTSSSKMLQIFPKRSQFLQSFRSFLLYLSLLLPNDDSIKTLQKQNTKKLE